MSGVWLLEELRIIPVSFCLLQAVFAESKENSGRKSLLDTGVCCSSYFFSPRSSCDCGNQGRIFVPRGGGFLPKAFFCSPQHVTRLVWGCACCCRLKSLMRFSSIIHCTSSHRKRITRGQYASCRETPNFLSVPTSPRSYRLPLLRPYHN